MARSTKKPAAGSLDLVTIAGSIASTIYARLESNAALAAAMKVSTDRGATFKETVFAAILSIREDHISRIPTGNKAIAEQVHKAYIRTLAELFGRGNAKQEGKTADDGMPAYLEGELTKQVRLHFKGDAAKLSSATSDFSRVRVIALAAWDHPTEATTGKLQEAARNAASLIKTGKITDKVDRGVKTGGKLTVRGAVEALIAKEGVSAAREVLGWAVELLASDAQYRKLHATALAQLTNAAKQL